jgi:hypothetical protein
VPLFLRLAAAGSAAFVVAQLIQRALGLWGPRAADEILQRLLPTDQLRLALVGGTIGLLPVAYAAVYLQTRRAAPGAALLGLIAGCGFVGFELAYRSIDLLVVSRSWAPAAAAGTLPAARFALWDELVQAWYLPLLLLHAGSSAGFAVATAARGDRWLSFALAANAVRAVLRSLQMNAGLTVLAPLNAALYLPVTLACYGGLALWLTREARRGGQANV